MIKSKTRKDDELCPSMIYVPIDFFVSVGHQVTTYESYSHYFKTPDCNAV